MFTGFFFFFCLFRSHDDSALARKLVSNWDEGNVATFGCFMPGQLVIVYDVSISMLDELKSC